MPASPASHRIPTTKPSLLSLRREKDRTASSDTPPSAPDRPFLVKRGPSYFERYPRQPSASSSSSASDSQKSALQRHQSLPRSLASNAAEPSSKSRLENVPPPHSMLEQGRAQLHIFPKATDHHPTMADFFANDGELTPRAAAPPSRRRPRTTSDKASRRRPGDMPHVRISDSSTLTQVETPPQTPIDFPMPRLFLDTFPVVVSAPVSGVETMDALVDGMNGYEGDDFFMGTGGISDRPVRSKERADRFHPLYQPPLPTPPPGVTLGGGLPRKSVKNNSSREEFVSAPLPTPTSSRRPPRPTPSRTASASTITVNTIASQSTAADDSPPASPLLSRRNSKSMAPSISDIIRTYAPVEQRSRARPGTARQSIYSSSHGHSVVHEEEVESEPEPVSPEEEAEMVSRSSVDSIADEVRRTLRNQSASPVVQTPAPPVAYTRSLPSRHSFMSDGSFNLHSPQFSHAPSSYYASSWVDPEEQTTPVDFQSSKPTQSQAIATYLRSSRLTTILKLTRSPHASIDNPLTVSLSDLGSPTGIPLVVFLGLGSVRYVMGLYDEMAECLGIRLITIDRWGLGRTDVPKHKSSRGIPEWGSVVEEVLDLLHIDQVSVMAHSAGAPYALSFANKVPERVRGDVLLLAPWVGGVEGAGYKWLKFVPNGILKTAQAAEWKIQAWMLGKPPTIAYQGIGFDATRSTPPSRPSTAKRRSEPRPVTAPDIQPRPSMGSSVFSEYDDLRDFDGRFDSRSTLGVKASNSHRNRAVSEMQSRPAAPTRKTSRSFLDRFKGSNNSNNQSPASDKSSPSSGGKRLKALRSMSSLKGRSSTTSQKQSLSRSSTARTPTTASPTSPSPPPQVPKPIDVDVGLGFGDIDWVKAVDRSFDDASPPSAKQSFFEPPDTLYDRTGYNRRADGRRSVSFGAAAASRSSPPSMINSPRPSTNGSAPSAGIAATSSYQAALGNALIAASHAESSKGTHSDLLQILNHDQQPWGFSYAAYPHRVRVWYGDRDEKIAENAVRWMERTMRGGRCTVNVVKGADHGLMYRSSVVVEVLERVRDIWADASEGF
ncbi:alpha/beta-hydrolase [Auriscalpium vulgare]|uniref:Alpha/beta-hydrolase n=1 Tax=Auriscalpium vulgare TaxID=40419 RepID=A0ACB8RWU3_9AGAM|nr:alpha/beta-hydrolase [Auriscalpium vulgare]